MSAVVDASVQVEVNPTRSELNPGLALARAVADAVLYEGYLLYPYRASATKNQSRWQFGVLGPAGAAAAFVGEESAMSACCLLRPPPSARTPSRRTPPLLTVRLRFLRLVRRSAQQLQADGSTDRFVEVGELRHGAQSWTTWDEATEHEELIGDYSVAQLQAGVDRTVELPGDEVVEELIVGDERIGRLVRSRESLRLEVSLRTVDATSSGLVAFSVRVQNTTIDDELSSTSAIARSLVGSHLLLTLDDGSFVSLLDPPEAAALVEGFEQRRCWSVLAGPDGQDDVLLISPIILYDHPAVAPESSQVLFDSTEIDEILILRILTLTEEEKAEARRTDPRAAAIIDRCEAMTPGELQQLHGTLRDPRVFDARGSGSRESSSMRSGDSPGSDGADAGSSPVSSWSEELLTLSTPVDSDAGSEGDRPWWHPEADSDYDPESERVLIDGTEVGKDSRVVIRPARRADAQDLFFAGQVAGVTGVQRDVDGSTHVAVVLVDDPAADLHDWYGRYLYFAPDELEPLPKEFPTREENTP